MKFTIPAKTLSDALNRARSVVPSRNPIPILGNVLLECGENLKVIAGSMDARLEQVLECKVAKPGSTTIPLEQFANSLKHFSGDVTCETDAKHVSTFSGGKLRLRLHGLGVEEFPKGDDFGESQGISVSFPDFKKCLARVAPFIAVPAQARPSLEGVLIEQAESILYFAAADGRRFAVTQMPGNDVAFKTLIPIGAVRIIMGLDAGDPFRLLVSESAVELRTCEWMFRTLLLAGDFTDWRRLREIAERKMNHEVRFDRNAALRAMGFTAITLDQHRRLYVSARKEDVSFATNGNAIGDSAAVIERKRPGSGECNFMVDPLFFRHALEACEQAEVSVQRPEDHGPLVLQEENFVSITMPLRVGEQK